MSLTAVLTAESLRVHKLARKQQTRSCASGCFMASASAAARLQADTLELMNLPADADRRVQLKLAWRFERQALRATCTAWQRTSFAMLGSSRCRSSRAASAFLACACSDTLDSQQASISLRQTCVTALHLPPRVCICASAVAQSEHQRFALG